MDYKLQTEDLLPELSESIKTNGTNSIIYHPLVQEPYHPQLNATYNKLFLYKKQAVKEALLNRDWFQLLGLYEKPYRIGKLLELQLAMTGKWEEYWPLVSFVWTSTENFWQYRNEISALVAPSGRDLSKRYLIMTKYERRVVASLPNPITIYRGCGFDNENGWSWTISRSQAEWFAKRFSVLGNRFSGQVLTGKCKRSSIIAYFASRREREIVIQPSHVTKIEVKT